MNLPVDPPKPKGGKLFRIVKKVLLGLALLVVIAAVAGAGYQAIANWKDARRFPQEGRSAERNFATGSARVPKDLD